MSEERETWTIKSRFCWQSGMDLLEAGDSLLLTCKDSSPTSVTIQGAGGETILHADVQLRSNRRRFEIRRGNGKNHPPSDQMRARFSIVQEQGVEILYGVLACQDETPGSSDDDDDTEVFVATNNPDPIG